MKNIRKILYIVPFLLLGAAGCKKDYLETKPSNGVTEEEIFSKLSTVYAALDGVGKELFANGPGITVVKHDAFGQKGFDLSSDLMANDMVVHSQGYGWFNGVYNLTEWGVATQNRQPDFSWFFYYDVIKQANGLLANVDNVMGASADEISSVKGQALGLRAYAYFYLINYFQQTYKGNESKPGVPIYTAVSTEGKPRGTVQDVYNQIISDLTEAETLLDGKTRASKNNIDVSVVRGFRARTALLMEDWPVAATYAAKARPGYTLMVGAEYKAPTAFSDITNPEWMWGSDIVEEESTIYASYFSHIDIRAGGYAALGGQKKITKALYDQIPVGDVRKEVFTAPAAGTGANPAYNQIKHQLPVAGNWAADYVYMRAAEMYLIEAEALARQSQDAPARTALETMVKTRFPAYSASTLSGADLLSEILLQRRIELWGEGFALMDVKRQHQGLNRPTGAGNHGSPNFDPGVYTTNPDDARFLMRIPQRELDNNSNMTVADQNP